MLYQYVKRYLKNKYNKPNTNIAWHDLDDIQFFTHIEKRYTRADFLKELSEVKEAFRDFFEPVGKIIFRYKEQSGIKFKIFPYRTHPKDSQHLQKIIQIILNNKKYIQYPYQHQNDQIAILGKIRRDINREIAETDESVNTKELIKYALKIALELSERDIIVQLKRKYIVKIFKQNNVVKTEEIAPPTKREGAANRYNGYTQEEIEETYKEIFIKNGTNVKSFLQNTMSHIFKNELNFRSISNQFYEENALKIIHTAIATELSDYISLEKDYMLGVTGYFMRKHFQEIHTLIAMELIQCIYDKDTNATEFLLFYNGNIILKNNKKYKIPSIKTEDGRQWNNASLIGICNLWMNTKHKKKQFEQKLSETNTKLKELEESLDYVKPEIESQENIMHDATVKYADAEKKHKEIEARFKDLERTSLNSNEYFQELKNFNASEKVLMSLKKVLDEATKKLPVIKNANLSTYTELEAYNKKKQQLLQDVKAQTFNLDSKSSQIDPIMQSIAKVLMQRTKIITSRV